MFAAFVSCDNEKWGLTDIASPLPGALQYSLPYSRRIVVPQRWALVVGIEQFQDAHIPPVPYAEADAEGLAEVLSRAEFPARQVVTLVGNTATHTSLESRLRKLSKTLVAGDELFFFYSGRGFSVEEQSILAAHDSELDDLLVTGLVLSDLWSRFATKGVRLRCLLDCGYTEIKSVQAELNENELDQLTRDYGGDSLVFLASGSEQPSQFAESLGHRLWGYQLRQALSGEAKIKKLGEDRQLTAEVLWSHLKSELPRTARKILASPSKQTPMSFGKVDSEVLFADLSRLTMEKEPATTIDVQQVKRIVFRAISSTRVKDLSGYQKGHRLPDQVTPSAKRFIAKIAMEDIRAEIEEMFNQLREQLGLKRKDLEANAEKEGLGFIRTPSFDYTLQAALDDSDPTVLRWTREVTHIQDPETIRSPGFQAVFGTMFDTLRFEFIDPVDVPAFIDRFEDEPLKGVKLRTSIDASSCDLTVEGFVGSIHLEPDCLVISGRSASAGSLIDQFFEFQKRFTRQSKLLMLK